MTRSTTDRFKLRLRWAIVDGLPRAALAIQARRGDLLARLLIGPQRGGDPYPLFEQIRVHGRLMRTPLAWATADHELCRTILRDKRFVVTSTANMNLPAPLTWLIQRTDPRLPHPGEPPSMLQVDPPEHSRYRHPVAHAFTPKAIDTLRTRITEVSAALLDRVECASHADLIADYAAPLPAAIIADILGIPAGQRPQMLERGDSGAPLLDIGVSWKTYRRGMHMLHASSRQINAQIDLLQAKPGDGIFSHIVEHGNLSRHELATTATLIAGAGFETTVNLIGNAIVLLLQHPDQLDMVRADPGLWPNAVEEVLRCASPVQMTSRTTVCEVELAGHHIPAHTTVALLLSGAIATQRSSPVRPASTSREPTPKTTFPSAAASTFASAPALRAWKQPWPYAPSSIASPLFSWTGDCADEISQLSTDSAAFPPRCKQSPARPN